MKRLLIPVEQLSRKIALPFFRDKSARTKSSYDRIWEFSCLSLAGKSYQSCPTLCDPIDGSPPGSPVPGILQARTLEWVAKLNLVNHQVTWKAFKSTDPWVTSGWLEKLRSGGQACVCIRFFPCSQLPPPWWWGLSARLGATLSLSEEESFSGSH